MSRWLSVAFALLSIHQSINHAVSATEGTSYSVDGLGDRFIFPQCATFMNDGSIAVFHYDVDGVFGQQGISIFDPKAINQSITRSISQLKQRDDTNLLPPSLFYDPEYVGNEYYASCKSMFTITRTIDQSIIELIAFDLPSSTYPRTHNVLIDRDGHYYGEWNDSDRPAPSISSISNPSTKLIVSIDNNASTLTLSDVINQITQTIDLGSRISIDSNVLISVRADSLLVDHFNNVYISALFSTSTKDIRVEVFKIHLSNDAESSFMLNDITRLGGGTFSSYWPRDSIGQISKNPTDSSIIFTHSDRVQMGRIVHLSTMNKLQTA